MQALQFITPNIVLIVFAFLGGFMILYSAIPLFEGLATNRWPSVQGIILNSRVEKRVKSKNKSGRPFYVPAVRYEYRIMSKRYEGNVISIGDRHFGKRRARKIARRFPKDTNVTIYFHPDQPKRSALIRGPSAASVRGVTVGLICVLLGASFGLNDEKLLYWLIGLMQQST